MTTSPPRADTGSGITAVRSGLALADPLCGDPDASAPTPDFSQLFQQAPCGYLLTDDDGTITSVNDTFLAWTGHQRHHLLGTQLHALMPIGDRILYTTHCMPALSIGGAVAEIAIEVIVADGQRRAALLSAARTPATDGHPAQVRVIIFSAHERRRYERELIAARRRAEESEARRASAEADLHHLAWHDTLTGLLNRAGLTAHLDSLGEHRPAAVRGVADACPPVPSPGTAAHPTANGPLGVLFIDLDHFKAVNDSLGHAAGDQLLTVVAARLQAGVRAEATVARLSGDEFVVIDALANAAQAAALAERLLEALNAPLVLEGLEVVVSASIGAAVACSDQDTPERLVRHADIAMYRAKAAGRNGWAVHDPTTGDPSAGRLRLLGELRHGIEAGQLRLHYQPRINLSSNQIEGVEALVRWQHPTAGLLPPAAFIDVAEDSGLVRELGDWVLNEAIAQAVQWLTAGHTGAPVTMAVNLSARQLGDPRLIDRVAAVLGRHGLPPQLLVLEITETALMHDPDTVLDTLRALKALGVSLAVDDFGTGYSSFTYLKRFPVDELKIDRSFVAGLGTDTSDSAIVASCINLAHAIGLHAVAEGVETSTQRTALLKLGCDLAQGYHWSPGLPAEDLTSWLTRLSAD
ncbi:Diguanylate cyclase/phosphodiesterase with PAS/PAC sensor(S) [Modestobacter italicus]|uniref:Diguanylate cyclase/phosphodiesterase with PAS/PAC sensor(S) n=1 Tax=Modestobacter italicus (strain DSM 44449 / CECT 9708 / BC 501) TaxID=2732864 RepID=I4F0L4_MODI5|nr:EAL domain-containing protein [Modestobacter marinus]CCH89177.1 Diguanylate cyclase/phosphodiesterase with PAS/PAC sensor(S) [Modestobacter marinus]